MRPLDAPGDQAAGAPTTITQPPSPGASAGRPGTGANCKRSSRQSITSTPGGQASTACTCEMGRAKRCRHRTPRMAQGCAGRPGPRAPGRPPRRVQDRLWQAAQRAGCGAFGSARAGCLGRASASRRRARSRQQAAGASPASRTPAAAGHALRVSSSIGGQRRCVGSGQAQACWAQHGHGAAAPAGNAGRHPASSSGG